MRYLSAIQATSGGGYKKEESRLRELARERAREKEFYSPPVRGAAGKGATRDLTCDDKSRTTHAIDPFLDLGRDPITSRAATTTTMTKSEPADMPAINHDCEERLAKFWAEETRTSSRANAST